MYIQYTTILVITIPSMHGYQCYTVVYGPPTGVYSGVVGSVMQHSVQ